MVKHVAQRVQERPQSPCISLVSHQPSLPVFLSRTLGTPLSVPAPRSRRLDLLSHVPHSSVPAPNSPVILSEAKDLSSSSCHRHLPHPGRATAYSCLAQLLALRSQLPAPPVILSASEGSLRLTLAPFSSRQLLTPTQPDQHNARARELIEATGARLWFLPICSPDLDPIGHAFGTLGHQRRLVAADTRTTVPAETERLWPTVTAANERASFQTAGQNFRDPL